MSKIKKIIGILLFSTTMCLAEVINGVLVLHPHEDIMYSLSDQVQIKKLLGLELKDSDPFVGVRALSDDGSSKVPVYLPKTFDEFPKSLPLSMLLDKKDGDQLIFDIDENTKVILTCNQKIQSQFNTFENQLAYLVKKFKKNPEYNFWDKKALVEKEIIVKTCFSLGKYKHGPNGYNLPK